LVVKVFICCLRGTHMREAKYIWLNGELVPWKEAKVHVLSHALHYGTGVFEGLRCYETPQGPAIFRPRDHFRRMLNGTRLYGIEMPYGVEELVGATKELIRANGLSSCYIRPIAFFGYGEMGVRPKGCGVDVAIAAWEWGKYLGEASVNGVRVMVSSWRRISRETLMPMVKCSGHYVNSMLASREASLAGYDEAIMLNQDGYVAEGPGENVFLVKDGGLITPSLSSCILPGITRDTVIELARDMGLEVSEREVLRDELYTADELFFAGTAAEITPIVEVDGIRIGDGRPGEITKKVRDAYYRAVRGEEERYRKWLEYV